jgi:hypothetical protein
MMCPSSPQQTVNTAQTCLPIKTLMFFIKLAKFMVVSSGMAHVSKFVKDAFKKQE